MITRDFIIRKFGEFNALIFGGRLPLPAVRLTDSGRFLGLCASKVRRLPGGRTEHYGFELRFNTRIDLGDRETEDVIIHEMIHYYIAWSGIKDTAPHGRVFRRMMRDINARFGRQVKVSRRLDAKEGEKMVSAKRTWHVVAAVRFRDGSAGVKVLPRIAARIAAYDLALAPHPEIASVSYWLHDDPWFNRFPVSGAFKVHSADASELRQHLRGARRLRIDGNRIVDEGVADLPGDGGC